MNYSIYAYAFSFLFMFTYLFFEYSFQKYREVRSAWGKNNIKAAAAMTKAIEKWFPSLLNEIENTKHFS